MLTDGVFVGAGDREDVAPGVVDVFRRDGAVVHGHADHVALLVQDVVVIGGVVPAGVGFAVGIVDDIQRIAVPGLAYNLAVQRIVMIGDTVHGLAVPDTGHVVGVLDLMGIRVRTDELTSLFPIKLPPGAIVVALRVSNFVVGDGLTIVSRQQVLPVRIAVGVGSLSGQNIAVLPG